MKPEWNANVMNWYRFLIETLHEKNDALFEEEHPYSFSKKIYELDSESEKEDAIPLPMVPTHSHHNHNSHAHGNGAIGGSSELHQGSDLGLAEDKATPGGPKKRKRKAKLMDPHAPKRPVNAFMVFAEMQRERMKQERDTLEKTQPESEDFMILKNLSKAAAARWKVLPEEDKQREFLQFKERLLYKNESLI